MNNTIKNIAIWALIGFVLFMLLEFFQSGKNSQPTNNISYSQFLSEVQKGMVESVEIRGNNISGKYSNGSQFITFSPGDLNLIDKYLLVLVGVFH